jgi:N utilization substance protein B
MTGNTSKKISNRGSAKARNSAARLLAVQAVYQMHKNDQKAEDVVRELMEHRAGTDYEGDGEVMVAPNEDHFALVVRGVSEHIAQLGEMISQNRGQGKNDPVVQPVADVVADTTADVIEETTDASEETVVSSEEVVEPIKHFKKTEPLLQAVFLCGAFELMVLQAIDAPVIISDYMHVTHAFFDKGEAKLVNALLDSIRKTVRD